MPRYKRPPIMIDTPQGRMTLREWAERNACNYASVYSRYKRQEIRDPQELVRFQPIGNPSWGTVNMGKPVLTEEKKRELRELAKYSDGMEDQPGMLCDFVPCARTWAPWLMMELWLK